MEEFCQVGASALFEPLVQGHEVANGVVVVLFKKLLDFEFDVARDIFILPVGR